MGRNKDTMKKKSESLSLVDKEVGVEKTVLRIGVDVRSRDFMTILRHRVANKCSERLKKIYNKTNKSKFA